MGNCFSVQYIFENILVPSWDSIVGKANYMCKLEETLKDLSAALDGLRARRNDVQRKVDLAEQQQLKRLDEVQLWLSNAETMITMAEQLIVDSPQEIDNLCLGSYVSKNCLSTYRFGEKVTEMLEDIKTEMGKGVFDKVAEAQPVASAVEILEERPIGLESTIDRVWSYIVDEDVGIIGLYGIGGVGKTTLLTQINNKLFSTKPKGLDFVIWVMVSKDSDIENIQDSIGEKIGLSDFWKNKKISVEQKAEDIYGALKNKTFVVLLDDLCERVDLKKIGIPKPRPPQTSHEIEISQPSHEIGSKVIFTTRSYEVCGEMEAQKKIRVECLKPEEAWKLFENKVGHDALNSHPDISKLAKQVAKECGGLPLALITIGRSMASKTTPAGWEYAIDQLKQSALPKMKDEVFPLLRFSYNNLPDTMKYCLLYCCLYPEDYNIPTKTLVEYWFCEGLLDEGDRINKAQMQGEHIIDSLVCACLLEKVEETIDRVECVKMHDVIRDMCLWIAREHEAKEKNFFVKAGGKREESFQELDVKAWKGAKRLSLMQNQIEVLREMPKCPKLQTLFLSKNKLKELSNDFFEFIPHLTVLNLSGNRDLGALPEGISQLVSLECLDLSTTGITELPIELKSLTKLKMLDLMYMSRIRKIPQHLISSFSKLQIFRMWYLPGGDYPEEDNVLDGDGNENLIEELKSLQHLNRLIIPPIKNMSALERFLSFHLFQCCTQVLLLKDFREPDGFNILRLGKMQHLELFGCEIMEEMKMEMLHTRISPRTDDTSRFLTMSKVVISSSRRLTDSTWLSLAPNLRYVKIIKCAKMEEILNEGKLGEVAHVVGTPFPKLETLDLGFLPELKSIHRHVLPFQRLKNIRIRHCSKLKKLPLDSDSAKGNGIIIQGSLDWWEGLEWENEATRHAFSRSFKSSKF